MREIATGNVAREEPDLEGISFQMRTMLQKLEGGGVDFGNGMPQKKIVVGKNASLVMRQLSEVEDLMLAGGVEWRRDGYIVLVREDVDASAVTVDALEDRIGELADYDPCWGWASMSDAGYSVEQWMAKRDQGGRLVGSRRWWAVESLPYGADHCVAVSWAGMRRLLEISQELEITSEQALFDVILRFRSTSLSCYQSKKPLVSCPGQDRKYVCNLPANIGGQVCNIVVPYRNRAENLDGFIRGFYEKVDHPYRILVVEQAEGTLFNRGRVCNVGFASKVSQWGGWWCFHDVDLIPESPACDYGRVVLPTHMSRHNSQTNYASTYDAALGGVTFFTAEHFKQINGYSNEYWGWGLEDDDLHKRCMKLGLSPVRRYGRYYSQGHKPKCEGRFGGTLEERAEQLKESSPFWLSNYHRMTGGYDYHLDGVGNCMKSTLFVGSRSVLGAEVLTFQFA